MPRSVCIGSLNIIALYIRDRASLNVAIYKELVPRPFEDMMLCLMSKALPHASGISMGWELFILWLRGFFLFLRPWEKKEIYVWSCSDITEPRNPRTWLNCGPKRMRNREMIPKQSSTCSVHVHPCQTCWWLTGCLLQGAHCVFGIAAVLKCFPQTLRLQPHTSVMVWGDGAVGEVIQSWGLTQLS